MPQIIEVIPNPYIALDKDGVPQGVVPAGAPGLYIGAAVDLVACQKTGKQRFYYPLDRDGKATKRVHVTSDIVTSVQCGELIVVDAAGAKACGITTKEFLPADKALEAEKAKALAYWQALHGDEKGPNTSAKIGDIPREPTKLATGENLPPQTTSKQLTPTVKLTKNTES